MNLYINARCLSSAMISPCDNKYQQCLQKRDHLVSEYTEILSYRIKILPSFLPIQERCLGPKTGFPQE